MPVAYYDSCAAILLQRLLFDQALQALRQSVDNIRAEVLILIGQ